MRLDTVVSFHVIRVSTGCDICNLAPRAARPAPLAIIYLGYAYGLRARVSRRSGSGTARTVHDATSLESVLESHDSPRTARSQFAPACGHPHRKTPVSTNRETAVKSYKN